MAYRVAINGFGRIGQCVLRALYENDYRDDIQIVAINELADTSTLSYLTRYDTTHGRFPGKVSHSEDELVINDEDHIRILRQSDPARLPWDRQEIDLLLECSGSFNSRGGG